MAQSSQLVNADFEGEIPPTKRVMIHAVAAGNAPKLTKAKFNAVATNSLHQVAKFIRITLKVKEDDSLFLFVKQTFQPPLDARIIDLAEVSQSLGSNNIGR